MTLKNGSTGDLVKSLQQKLGLTSDGVFGNNTENTLKDWQSKNGLTPDGIAGDETLAKMGINPVTSGVDFDSIKGKVPDEIFKLLPAAFEKYGIDDSLKAAHFLSQISHESGDFTIKTESLYYKTPSRIVDIWPSRFNLDGSDGKKNANEYILNEQKLASAVYDGRMGNDQPGDGYTFRGAGFLQLTGKDAFKGYASYIGKSLEETANLVRTDNYYALDAALWEYCISMKLNSVAEEGASTDIVKKITRVVNGGYIGLDDRIAEFNKYYSLLS